MGHGRALKTFYLSWMFATNGKSLNLSQMMYESSIPLSLVLSLNRAYIRWPHKTLTRVQEAKGL